MLALRVDGRFCPHVTEEHVREVPRQLAQSSQLVSLMWAKHKALISLNLALENGLNFLIVAHILRVLIFFKDLLRLLLVGFHIIHHGLT